MTMFDSTQNLPCTLIMINIIVMIPMHHFLARSPVAVSLACSFCVSFDPVQLSNINHNRALH